MFNVPHWKYTIDPNSYDKDKLLEDVNHNYSLDKSRKPRYTKEEIKAGKKSAAPMPDYDTYKKGSYHDYDVGGDKPPRWEKQPVNKMAGK